MARLRYLERDHIEFIAHRLAARLFTDYGEPLPAFQLFGGLREGGGLLESALGLPRQPYYRTLHDKAGALLRSLIKNHPLVDGNKRMAMTATCVFLAINGHFLLASNEEMVRFALELAASEPDMDWKDVAGWLRKRTINMKASADELRGRLAEFPNDWQDPDAVVRRLKEYGEAFAAMAAELRDETTAERIRHRR